MKTTTIRADKIGSATVNLRLRPELEISDLVEPEVGNVVVVRALTENANYNKLELTSGRLARINPQDIIVGVLGKRRALKGFVGDIPEDLHEGDKLHILNLGGIIGECKGHFQAIGKAIEAEYLGTVIKNGQPLNIGQNAPESIEKLESSAPLIFIAGTCMNSGKTLACTELIKHFTRLKEHVAAAKLSGIACLRDTMDMIDHGATEALSFLDCGHPSTVGIEDIAPLARTLITQLNRKNPDVIVIELGDGILGGYNVDSIFQEDIMEHIAAVVFCANDFVGAWGGIELLKQKGIEIDVMAGPATDSQMGIDFIKDQLGVSGANALNGGKALFRLVRKKVEKWRNAK